MYAAALRIELRIPEARSLKAKRRILQSLIADLRERSSVSVAEVDHHDEWQRSTVGIALVAARSGELDRRAAAIRRMLEERVDIELLEIGLSYLEDPQ